MSLAVRRAGVIAAVVLTAMLFHSTPALAHGFTSTAYVELTSPATGHVRTELLLEYDLLIASAAEFEHNDPLFRSGQAAFEGGDPAEQAAALEAHVDSVVAYVTQRFGVAAEGEACTPNRDGGFSIEPRDGVPYARLALDYLCAPAAAAHEVRSELFPDSEGYVRDTKTIVSYDLDLRSGSAALDAEHRSFSTGQSTLERFSEFFRLGAEHLLTGLDHILFLLALIAGSRRLREMVLAATTFTLAHSVTFVLAALGFVHVPARLVEPAIALSIAVVAGWHLWRGWQLRFQPPQVEELGRGDFGLDRAGWARLAVVFCFGLVHGLGFASALGINQAWSWTLLWSLLVFNVGIEAVQLAVILAVFPLLVLLRRRQPVQALWTTGTIAAGVSAMGLVWFVQRIFAV